ncbi:hypothetical protein BTR23_07525 [Alkalihalophilus pseudofirmus]|nr:hypothetical protein BTR23_07525 [Alkalihalophilus pseudofirmus]
MTTIKNAKLKFPKSRTPIKKVDKIVIHHPVANWTIQRLHDYFLGKGWNGTAYNYYVQKNGDAFYGRSSANQEFQGAHASGHNLNTIGVCAEGNFEVEHMQPKQYNKLVDVVAHLCKKHKLNEKDVLGHKELKGASTACPGKNFDLNKFRNDVKAKLNPPKQQSSNKLYRVQVGAFTNKDNAERLAEELKSKGYSVFIAE